ncbi:MAG TPA: cytochrome c peroxidase [Chitinophagaceae bacterium]
MRKYWILIAAATLLIMFQAFVPTKEPATKAELGELLFFDPILSSDSTISCASCHKPDFAFADTSAVSLGVGGAKGNRNTPSAMNVLLQQSFFWDGRAASLEDQALKPIENPVEMNLPLDVAIARLKQSKTYSVWFKKIFKTEPSPESLAQAIAAFERTLETSDSPFDDWKYSDRPDAVSEAVKRGFNVFNTKGKCSQCHFGADFASPEFRNIGLFNGKDFNDSGRATITLKADDLGRFKIGPLRNIALTGPYMHNGMFKTLEEVIEFYNDTEKIIKNPINKDSLLAKPLGLTAQDKSDLLAFMLALTDKRFTVNDNSAYPFPNKP